MIDKSSAAEMFVACCIAHGYLHDSSRGELANEIQDDIKGWYMLLGSNETERQVAVLQILNQATSDWVRLYCAALLKPSMPQLADEVFARCEGGSGAKASLASVWRRG